MVITQDGDHLPAIVYTCSPQLLSETPWDREVFIRDHLQYFMAARARFIEF